MNHKFNALLSRFRFLSGFATILFTFVFAGHLAAMAAPVCSAVPGTALGDASILASNEIQLTPATNTKQGEFWAAKSLDLTLPFDIPMQVFLGSNDANGADGLAFVLRPSTSASLGQSGRGIGAGDGNNGTTGGDITGITPSFIVEIDTYGNTDYGWSDPAADHVAAYLNGNGRHNGTTTDIVSPISIANIEDGAYHAFRLVWNPATKIFSIWLNGSNISNTTIDLAAKLGTSNLVWGYTASTGGFNNRQAVCNQMPTLKLSKTSVGGVGPFSFSATNGWGSSTLTTATSGTAVSSTTIPLGVQSSATTITEAIPAGYSLTAASCSGLGAGTAMSNLGAGSVSLDAAAVAPTNAIVCSFTNSKLPTMTVTKISNGGVGGFTFTGTNGWTSQTITTVTAGTGVIGATQTLAAQSTITTITESIPVGYKVTAISCTGIGAGTATPNLAAGSVALDAVATAPGNAISCTFTNGATSFSLLKTVSNSTMTAPGTLTYTIKATNTGSASLTSLSFVDTLTQGGSARALTSGPVLSSGDTNSNGILDVSEVWTYTATYLVTQADIDNGGTFSNVFTLDTAETAPLASNIAMTAISQSPDMTIVKTANKSGPLVLGEVITYNYYVTNTGNTTLTAVSVSETAFNGTGGTTAVTPSGGASTLAPGASTTFTATYPVTQNDIDGLQ